MIFQSPQNTPFRPIVSACGTSMYKLANCLTKILQQYCGNNFPFVQNSKGLVESIKEQNVAADKTLVSFDVSALCTIIPVPGAFKN